MNLIESPYSIVTTPLAKKKGERELSAVDKLHGKATAGLAQIL